MHIRTLLLSDFQPDWKWRLEKIKCTNCTIARQRQHRVRSNVANNSSKDEYIYKKKYISWVYFNHVSFGHRLAAHSHCKLIQRTSTLYDVRCTYYAHVYRCSLWLLLVFFCASFLFFKGIENTLLLCRTKWKESCLHARMPMDEVRHSSMTANCVISTIVRDYVMTMVPVLQ